MPAPALIGSYTAPRVTIGARVDCLFRDCSCVVTSITDAPIPWPRVQPCDQRGGCGLLVNDELARAIRTESAAAIMCHFGASSTTVWKWRRTFGVGGHTGTPGSVAAITSAARKGADAVKSKEWTDEERDAQAARSRALGLKPDRWTGRGGWTVREVMLLDTLTDAEVAERTGRSLQAVRCKRRREGRP